MFTSETVYVLVTCSLEESRQVVLEEVIDNIRSQECASDIIDNLIIFDNCSKIDRTISSLKDAGFKHLYQSDKNVGYWSAMHWCLKNVDLTKYKYVHMIESDMLFDDYSLLSECESFLKENEDLHCVRTNRFEVDNKHLYDKRTRFKDSNTNCWQTLANCHGSDAYFNHVRDKFYRTNLPAVVCGLLRIDTLNVALDELSTKKRFVEHDYQKLMFKISNEIALYDGGLYTCSNNTKVASSWPNTSSKFGYRESRADKIEDQSSYSVRKI